MFPRQLEPNDKSYKRQLCPQQKCVYPSKKNNIHFLSVVLLKSETTIPYRLVGFAALRTKSTLLKSCTAELAV